VVDGNLSELLAFQAKTRRSSRARRMSNAPASLRARLAPWVCRALCVPAVVLYALVGAGCGNTLYAVQISAASSKLEEARELGAEQYAPYEYWFAFQHIEKAQSEASEADYSDAVNLAEIGEEYADKAIKLARDAHRGAGR
jgi:hypothetical protein